MTHFKTAEDTLYKPEASKETVSKSRTMSETRQKQEVRLSPQRMGNFFDRTNMWLKHKQNKLELAKVKQEKKEE